MKVRLITTISNKDVLEFVKTLEVDKTELCNVEPKFYDCLKKIIEDNTGFSRGCLLCLQSVEGESASLEKHFEEVSDYLPTGTGVVMLEMLMEHDLVFSLPFLDFLKLNKMFKGVSELELHFLEEDLRELITIGPLKDEDEEGVISFIPMFYAKDCTQFLILNDTWEGEQMELAGIKPVQLNRMNIGANMNIEDNINIGDNTNIGDSTND